MEAEPRTSRVAFWLASGGVLWAALFTWWALTASAYAPDGQTILEANPEATVRVAIAIPVVVSALVWLALHLACRFDSRTAQALGIAGAGLLVLFSVVTGFSIGMGVYPGAAVLLAAAVLTPVRSR